MPLENLLTETDTPYFPRKEVFFSYQYLSHFFDFSPLLQHNTPAIGVPGLALECAREIAALRGDDLGVVLTALRNNVKNLYNIDC